MKNEMDFSQTTNYFADSVLLPNGWAENILIQVDANGWIKNIEQNAKKSTLDCHFECVIPGMLNVHSHAFQRAMAGCAEYKATGYDDFWSWRTAMYRFLERLNPEDQNAIAAQLYVEMLKAGYTTVGEFHYLHHQMNGVPYNDRASSSHAIITAAKTAGIAITHLPTLYRYSGFGYQPPLEIQKRFINNESKLFEIIESLSKTYHVDPQITIGLAHHSLRAVSKEMMLALTKVVHSGYPQAPIHIHIAEQKQEIDDCLTYYHRRPVEWLLDEMNVDERWTLIHATHLTETELLGIVKSGAVIGLCPTTEANLGDGLFNLPVFIANGGPIGIGSDSNISISMIEELRWLEYGQRLKYHQRSIANREYSSIGASLYHMALYGGAKSLNRATGQIAIGKRADFIALDMNTPNLFSKRNDFILDSLIFSGNTNPIRDVIAGGKHIVKDYHHILEVEIFDRYKKTLSKLFS